MKKLLIGVVALGISAVAFASGDTYTPPPAKPAYMPGVYLGLQAGFGMTNWDNVDKSLLGLTTSNENCFAGRAFLGYDFHKNFAVEAGYTQFFNTNTNIKVAGITVTEPENNWVIDMVGKIKATIVDNFGLYAKVGVDYIYTQEGIVSTKSEDAFNVVYGAGAYYEVIPNLVLDVSWTRYNGDEDIQSDYIPAMDLFAGGISYKFNLA